MEKEVSKQSYCQFSGVRYVFSTAGFFGLFAVYAVRVNINVAIVSMVNASVYIVNNSSDTECKSPYTNVSDHLPTKTGEFDWSPEVQAAILGSFYYGYCISQIPGGRLAEIYNAKWVFGLGTFIPALLTLIFPMAARHSTGALIAIRAIEGLIQGVTFPAMHSLIGHWLPESEKAFLSTIIYSGLAIGTVATMYLTGVLCSSEFLGGWPSAFYVAGIFVCIWFVFWCIFVTETPVSNPFITKKELDYITANSTYTSNKQLPPFPWRKVLTSLPFWAVMVVQVGGEWADYTVLNDLPTYFGTILHFEIKDNGFLSSYPHILQTALGLLVSITADSALRRNLVSKIFIRKFCTFVCAMGPALAYLGVCLAGCNVSLNILFLALASVLGAFYYSGYNISHLDLSPEYAGTLMGITNTVSAFTGFLAPMLVGTITQHHQGLYEWRIIFAVVIIIQIISGSFYVAFASADKQDWIETEEINDEEEKLIQSSSPSPTLNKRYLNPF